MTGQHHEKNTNFMGDEQSPLDVVRSASPHERSRFQAVLGNMLSWGGNILRNNRKKAALALAASSLVACGVSNPSAAEVPDTVAAVETSANIDIAASPENADILGPLEQSILATDWIIDQFEQAPAEEQGSHMYTLRDMYDNAFDSNLPVWEDGAAKFDENGFPEYNDVWTFDGLNDQEVLQADQRVMNNINEAVSQSQYGGHFYMIESEDGGFDTVYSEDGRFPFVIDPNVGVAGQNIVAEQPEAVAPEHQAETQFQILGSDLEALQLGQIPFIETQAGMDAEGNPMSRYTVRDMGAGESNLISFTAESGINFRVDEFDSSFMDQIWGEPIDPQQSLEGVGGSVIDFGQISIDGIGNPRVKMYVINEQGISPERFAANVGATGAFNKTPFFGETENQITPPTWFDYTWGCSPEGFYIDIVGGVNFGRNPSAYSSWDNTGHDGDYGLYVIQEKGGVALDQSLFSGQYMVDGDPGYPYVPGGAAFGFTGASGNITAVVELKYTDTLGFDFNNNEARAVVANTIQSLGVSVATTQSTTGQYVDLSIAA